MNLAQEIRDLLARHEALRVLPIARGTKAPDGRLAPNGVNDASRRTAKWWDEVEAYGVTGVAIVDIDDPTVRGELPELPETFTVRTRKGLHLYFAEQANRPLAGVNVNDDEQRERASLRVAGRYVLGHGSQHPDGGTYEIEVDAPIATAPDTLYDWVASQRSGVVEVEANYDGEPNEAWGAAVLEARVEELRNAAEGGRNNALFAAACRAFEVANGRHIDADDAADQLRDVAESLGLDDFEIEATLDSARKTTADKAVGPDDSIDFGNDDNIAATIEVLNDDESDDDNEAPFDESQLRLPEDFWEAMPELAHIRLGALAGSASPDAVLQGAFARIAAFGDPNLVLPAVKGRNASLNYFAAIVGRSGAGKSIADQIAEDLLPTPVFAARRTAGSGQSIAAAYWESVKRGNTTEWEIVRHNALLSIDEGETMNKLATRTGDIFMSVLRTVWVGGDPGTSGVGKETTRNLPRLSYRLGAVVNYQPSVAGPLLADVNGGTPQRFVFAYAKPVRHPGGRKALPKWPGPLDSGRILFGDTKPVPVEEQATMLRDAPRTPGELIEVDVPECVKDEVYDFDPESVDLIDQHAMLARLKVAALLAQLNGGRTNVTVDDWRLTGIVMDTSRKVRSWTLGEVKQFERDREDENSAKAARRVIDIERRKADGKKLVGAYVRKISSALVEAGGRLKWSGKGGYLQRRVRPPHRDAATAAMHEGLGKTWNTETDDGATWLVAKAA